MYFKGQRKTVPSSRYWSYLLIIEETGWTLNDILDAPADLITEMAIRITKRNREKARQSRLQEQRARRANQRRR